MLQLRQGLRCLRLFASKPYDSALLHYYVQRMTVNFDPVAGRSRDNFMRDRAQCQKRVDRLRRMDYTGPPFAGRGDLEKNILHFKFVRVIKRICAWLA
jgi:hypothetical protein